MGVRGGAPESVLVVALNVLPQVLSSPDLSPLHVRLLRGVEVILTPLLSFIDGSLSIAISKKSCTRNTGSLVPHGSKTRKYKSILLSEEYLMKISTPSVSSDGRWVKIF